MIVGRTQTKILLPRFVGCASPISNKRRVSLPPRSSLVSFSAQRPRVLATPISSPRMASLGTAPPRDGPDVATSAYKPRYIDIGINLADPIFRGVYNGKQRHDDDLDGVVDRARQVGCTKLIVTGSSLKSSRDALAIAEKYPGTVYTTAGIHPCSSSIFDAAHPRGPEEDEDENAEPEHTTPCDPGSEAPPMPQHEPTPDPARTQAVLSSLRSLVAESGRGASSSPGTGRLVALGEFGLDYDRLHYCPRSLQLHSFAAQLSLVASLPTEERLPLFLHSRAAHADFVACLKDALGPKLERLSPRSGVVHSFTGTAAEAEELMDMGLYIGINGCSFKTAENCEVVRAVRLDRLMIETDGPWCEVRPSHEGWKHLLEMERREREAAELLLTAESAPETEQPPVNAVTDGANPDASQTVPRPRKQKQQQSSKKPQKKASEVVERFKTVKKEKWVEGAMVKGRNEPCTIERVAKIIAAIKGAGVEEVCEAAWRNTVEVFGLDET